MTADKQLTRWAQSGPVKVLMYGNWWLLERGVRYAVEFNKKHPPSSRVVKLRP